MKNKNEQNENKIKFKTNYNQYSIPTQFMGESVTQEQFSDECDINNIVNRYINTGYLPPSSRQGQYLDLSKNLDFFEAQKRVQDAEQLYMEIPAQLRDHFSGAGDFLNSFNTEDGLIKLKKLGFIQADLAQDEPNARGKGESSSPNSSSLESTSDANKQKT